MSNYLKLTSNGNIPNASIFGVMTIASNTNVKWTNSVFNAKGSPAVSISGDMEVQGEIRAQKITTANGQNLESLVHAMYILLLQKGIINDEEEFNDIVNAVVIADKLTSDD